MSLSDYVTKLHLAWAPSANVTGRGDQSQHYYVHHLRNFYHFLDMYGNSGFLKITIVSAKKTP